MRYLIGLSFILGFFIMSNSWAAECWRSWNFDATSGPRVNNMVTCRAACDQAYSNCAAGTGGQGDWANCCKGLRQDKCLPQCIDKYAVAQTTPGQCSPRSICDKANEAIKDFKFQHCFRDKSGKNNCSDNNVGCWKEWDMHCK